MFEQRNARPIACISFLLGTKRTEIMFNLVYDIIKCNKPNVPVLIWIAHICVPCVSVVLFFFLLWCRLRCEWWHFDAQTRTSTHEIDCDEIFLLGSISLSFGRTNETAISMVKYKANGAHNDQTSVNMDGVAEKEENNSHKIERNPTVMFMESAVNLVHIWKMIWTKINWAMRHERWWSVVRASYVMRCVYSGCVLPSKNACYLYI